MTPTRPLPALSPRAAHRREAPQTRTSTDAVMALLVGGVLLFAALPFLDFFGVI